MKPKGKVVQLAMHCRCGREAVLAHGMCATCYTLRRQDEEYFGGLREAVLERDGYRCWVCDRQFGRHYAAMWSSQLIRVLIADDEQPARQRLRHLLSAHICEVVGEAATGAETMALIAATAPDVVFLDIDMPQGNGLDVAASLYAYDKRIVFCTAYDEHAVDAFELSALDYLLKPVSRSRLAKTWARLTTAIETGQAFGMKQRPAKQNAFRFVVRSGSRYVVVPVNDVLRFDSLDGLTRLTTHAGKQF